MTYRRIKTEQLKGFDQKYVEALWNLGAEYIEEFYDLAQAEREPMKSHLGIDDSELERLLKIAENVLSDERITEAKNLEEHSRGLIAEDKPNN